MSFPPTSSKCDWCSEVITKLTSVKYHKGHLYHKRCFVLAETAP